LRRRGRASRRAPVLALALAFAAALVVPAGVFRAEEGPAGGGLAAGSLPPLVEGGPAFQLPSGDPRALYRRAPEAAPLPVRAFWEAAEPAEWEVHWDPLLETPYLVYPLESHALASPEAVASSDPEELATSARSFVEEHAELFGVEPEELSPASVIALGPYKVVRFSQRTRSGIPLRGAGLRVVVRADGRLAWVMAFPHARLRSPPSLERSSMKGRSRRSRAASARSSST
jgi:hypothetical protein